MRSDRDKRTDSEREIDDFLSRFDNPSDELSADINSYLNEQDNENAAVAQTFSWKSFDSPEKEEKQIKEQKSDPEPLDSVSEKGTEKETKVIEKSAVAAASAESHSDTATDKTDADDKVKDENENDDEADDQNENEEKEQKKEKVKKEGIISRNGGLVNALFCRKNKEKR